jgi:hypothetical protein
MKTARARLLVGLLILSMLEGVLRGGSSLGFFQASSLLVAKIQRHGEG